MFPDLMRDDVFRLETERLWLRWPRASDVARIADYAGDRDLAEMTALIPHPYPPGAAAEFVLTSRAANLAGRQATLVLTPKHRPNEILGCVGLVESGERLATLGFWLGKPFWRRGYMTEAVCGLVELAMRAVELDAVIANARPDNLASRRVLEKTGFSPDGFGVVTSTARGGPVAVRRFRLARPDWRDCRSLASERREHARAI